MGGSGAFLGHGSDGRDYWIKTLNNHQDPRVPITEQLVGRAGALVCNTCCSVETMYIPKSLEGWDFRGGRTLVRGFAHASLALANAVEAPGVPAERQNDNNAVRHVGYFALYDWCWGSDPQGLLAIDENRAYYSHDHGLFLPPEGSVTWSIGDLLAQAETAHEFGGDSAGLDQTEIKRVATRLENVTRNEILGIVSNIPRSWPVTNQELDHVGAFLEFRAPRVAQRLRAHLGATP